MGSIVNMIDAVDRVRVTGSSSEPPHRTRVYVILGSHHRFHVQNGLGSYLYRGRCGLARFFLISATWRMIPAASPPRSSGELFKNTSYTSMRDDLAMPIISIHERALEVCYTIYGEAELSSDILDRFYEPSASELSSLLKSHVLIMFSVRSSFSLKGGVLICSRYQNPALSASSRTVIHNIFKLGRKIHGLDVPRPLAVFYTLLHLQPPDFVKDPIFQVLRAWNDVGTVSEHESFGTLYRFRCSANHLTVGR